jgi:putative DNA primase/helicase
MQHVQPNNPGAEYAALTARLAALDPFEYEKVRRFEAKQLGVSVVALDAEVQRARRERKRQSGAEELFPTVTPWPEAVDPRDLLNEIHQVVRTFIICDPETAVAATLWIAFTWFIDHVQVAPLAVITAPEKRCGKSQLLNLIGALSRRPLTASNISPAALYRVIESHAPTLLIDEVDTFLGESEELRGVINSGHSRRAAFVVRTTGDDHKPRQFSTWGAKALSGIGTLADTLMDRAIVLNLRRKLPGENVERLRYADTEHFGRLLSKLARFEQDAGQAVGRARPLLPMELNDRAQDNWEPLLAIADLAGGHWPQMARDAARLISEAKEESVSLSVELLADVHDIFETTGAERMTSTELLRRLSSDELKRWSTFHRGQPMTARQFAKQVSEFGVEPRTLRFGDTTAKGYQRSDFADAFRRYLPSSPPLPAESVTRSQNDGNPAKQGTFAVTEVRSRSGHHAVAHPCRNVAEPVTGKTESFQRRDRVTAVSGGGRDEIITVKL